MSFSGEDAFDRASERASFALDMSAFAELLGEFFSALGGANATDAPDLEDPPAWKIEVVQDGATSYVHFPAVSKQLPAGKTWIRSDGKSLNIDGFELGELEQFVWLDGAGLVRKVELSITAAGPGPPRPQGVHELRAPGLR